MADSHKDSDTLTVVAIALVAYMLGTMLHEGLGHGGACLLTGGKVIEVSTVSMDCSADNRWVIAGGTLVNFIAAAIFFAAGRNLNRATTSLRYFCWISMTINLFTATGYFLFSGIGGFGDWAMFIRGLGPELPWRVGMAIFGAITYLMAARFSLLELRPLIGSDKTRRSAGAVRLSRLPYFAGGTLNCIAGALNPHGWILVALSAAASTFGGTSGLLWMMNWLRGDAVPPGDFAEPAPIQRNWPWIAAASVLAVGFISVLGPGVRPR